MTEKNPYRQLIYRPFWITLSGLVIILSIALTLLINSSWNALHRTKPLKAHMATIEEVQRYNLALEKLTDKLESALTKKQLLQINRLSQGLIHILNTSKGISDEARSQLLQAVSTLKNIQESTSNDLRSAQKNIQIALHLEIGIQNNLLNLLARDNKIELETTTSIAIIFPLIGLLTLFFFRHHILRPLDNLSLLIARVGRKEIPDIPMNKIDPLLKPLFTEFGNLLKRLSELEVSQIEHQHELESKVRDATQSLLEHHYTLAHSERLAVLGELSAGLAHELRNPLAGIYLALVNLRNETNDHDKVSRLTLVIEELDRVTILLNQMLGQSRHSPESSVHFNLAETLSSLLQLVRYQIPRNIKIEQSVSKNIQCYLPQGRLRQAMLNLMLNAAQSIQKSQGVIHISASSSEDRLVIQVRDNGKGFPQKLLDAGAQLFMTGHENGTGLGLAIVRRFCYEQGGVLLLKNPNSGGACAEIILDRNSSNG